MIRNTIIDSCSIEVKQSRTTYFGNWKKRTDGAFSKVLKDANNLIVNNFKIKHFIFNEKRMVISPFSFFHTYCTDENARTFQNPVFISVPLKA